MNYLIPFSSKSIDYTEEEISVINNTIKNSNILTMGNQILNFEAKFEKFLGRQFAFALNSATSCLELSAQLCRFKLGDEVIIPSHTYTSSCYPFIKNKAKIVWADIDLENRVVSDDSILSNISNKTRAVVVPHLYGYFKDLTILKKELQNKEIFLIEDVAQAIGTKIKDKMSGSYGDLSIFSFHSHKNITTLGEGGMLVVGDKSLATEIPKLRHNGHCDFNYTREEFWKPAMGNLDVTYVDDDLLLPNNFCIAETQCALGSSLLDRVMEINKKKRQRALYFIDELKNFDILKFHRVETEQHNYHLLAAYFNNTSLRDKFFHLMAHEESIQCAVQYLPLNRYDFYKKLGYGEANCPNSDFFFDHMVSFPFHHRLTDNEIDQILSSTKKILKRI